MKQETLEEAAKGYSERHQDVSGNLGKYLVSAVFQDGAKWQQEDMIEKLEMHILINEDDWNRNPQAQFRNFIEQFKKK